MSLPKEWVNGEPPAAWERTLSIDVGGASPWGWLWCALDPDGNVIAYDELYEAGSNVEKLVNQALPKMAGPDGQPLHFRFKCCDYENRVAMEDLRRLKIHVTDAVKHTKVTSIHRLRSYIHPNPKHAFPEWHPRAGQLGSPRLFVLAKCKNLRRELPQQRWKQNTTQGGSLKDEADKSIADHLVDALLYTVRLLPDPATMKVTVAYEKHQGINLQSRLYWLDVEKQKAKEAQNAPRRPYRISKIGSLLE